MKLLEFIYGSDYHRLLREELIVIRSHKREIWALAVLMNVIVTGGAVAFWPLNQCFSYFTDWTMWMTFVQVLFMFWSARKQHINNHPGWLAFTHSAYTVCLICNVIVVIIYWSLLHEKTLLRHEGNIGRTYHTYISHSFPCISILLVYWINEIRLHVPHWKGLNLIGLFYGICNYLNWKKTGVVLYPFLDWADNRAYFNIVLLAAVFSGIYVGIAKASYWLKPIHTKVH